MRLVLMAAAFLLLPSPSSASQTVSISDATGRTPVVVAGATPEDIAVKLATAGLAPDPKPKSEPSAEEVCETLNAAADAHDLPTPFFIRLIWQESRFDRKAVSPVGAQGVAQFMPATASAMGLEDPFDPIAALPMSAQLLRTLRNQFGNLGLAAAAYNAGPKRVVDWLAKRGVLPKETRDYVHRITGRPAEDWRGKNEVIHLETAVPRRAPCRPDAPEADAQAAVPATLSTAIASVIPPDPPKKPAAAKDGKAKAKLAAKAKGKTKVAAKRAAKPSRKAAAKPAPARLAKARKSPVDEVSAKRRPAERKLAKPLRLATAGKARQ
ncbi:MAG: lytic transglycosylase domain-containing protein [Bradyrhizobiaceae bacterium]|nr:MAG: lytic transglycosylase domain-containing protein [Bradyrhizobiaceae bacterium]